MRKGRISKKPTRAMLDRALPREVMPLGDGVWRVAGHHRDRVEDGYVVVDDGDCIRCECRAAKKGRWCPHRLTIWSLLYAWDDVKPFQWSTDYRIVYATRPKMETIYSDVKRMKACFKSTCVYGDAGYLSDGARRG